MTAVMIHSIHGSSISETRQSCANHERKQSKQKDKICLDIPCFAYCHEKPCESASMVFTCSNCIAEFAIRWKCLRVNLTGP